LLGGRLTELAAIENGVGLTTLRTWMAKGDEENADPLYRDFRRAIKSALQQAKQKSIDAIMEARDGVKTTKIKTVEKTETVIIDGVPVTRTTKTTTQEVGSARYWQAAAWLLERQYPEEFARVYRPDDDRDDDDSGPKLIRRGMMGPGEESVIDVEATEVEPKELTQGERAR